MRYLNEQALSIPDVSVDTNSGKINASNLYRVSCQIVASGSPSATVVLQGSNDVLAGSGMNTGSYVPTNWTTIPNTSTMVSSATTYLIPSTEVCYMWIRVAVTGGGTGTLTANIQGQGF